MRARTGKRKRAHTDSRSGTVTTEHVDDTRPAATPDGDATVACVWATHMLQTFRHLCGMMYTDRQTLELELRQVVRDESTWNTFLARYNVLRGQYSSALIGTQIGAATSTTRSGWEYKKYDRRYRHWNGTVWTGVPQKKMPMSSVMCSAGKIAASVETDYPDACFAEGDCARDTERVWITRTTTVLRLRTGWTTPSVAVTMTERSRVAVSLLVCTSRDVEIELVLTGPECHPNGDVDIRQQDRDWEKLVQCMIHTWRWLVHGIIGTRGMVAAVGGTVQRQNQGPFAASLTSGTIPIVRTDGRRMVTHAKQSTNSFHKRGRQGRGLVVGDPFTIVYDGNNFAGTGSVWIRRGYDGVATLAPTFTRISRFLVDDNSKMDSTEVPSALVSSKTLRYSAKSGPQSAFTLIGVVVTGIYVVTQVLPAHMSVIARRCWPRTFAVHFLDMPATGLHTGWYEEKVQWDVVRRIHTKMSHILRVTTLLSVRVVGQVLAQTGRVLLAEDDCTVLATVCIDTVVRRGAPLLYLTATAADGGDVVILVEMCTAGLPVYSITSKSQFQRMLRTEGVMVGRTWVTFNCQTRTFRCPTDFSQPLSTLFDPLCSYADLLWMVSELGGADVAADVWVGVDGHCYANLGGQVYRDAYGSSNLIRIASTTSTLHENQDPIRVGRYTVCMSPQSRLQGGGLQSNCMEHCVGTIECVSLTFVAPTAEGMSPIKLL
jgi:hypothetical protein